MKSLYEELVGTYHKGGIQMAWVGAMNQIRSAVEEIVSQQLIHK